MLTLSGHLRTLAALQKGRPPQSRRTIQVSSHETHISAQQNQARTYPRFPCPYGHQSRATGDKAPSCKRPRAVVAVTPPRSRTAASDKDSNQPGLADSHQKSFTKENRLLDAAAFGRVFEKASRSRDKLFTVLCRHNEAERPRLGLAISKKNCRRATGRNRIKRIIRESFREHQQALDSLDIVVINQAAAANASNRQMFDSLAMHWQQCGKAKPTPQER